MAPSTLDFRIRRLGIDKFASRAVAAATSLHRDPSLTGARRLAIVFRLNPCVEALAAAQAHAVGLGRWYDWWYESQDIGDDR